MTGRSPRISLLAFWLLLAVSALADKAVPYDYQVSQARARLQAELAGIPPEQHAGHVRRRLDALKPPTPPPTPLSTQPSTLLPTPISGAVRRPSAAAPVGIRPVWNDRMRPDPEIVALEEWLANHQSSTPSPAPSSDTQNPGRDAWGFRLALLFVAAGGLLGLRRFLARR